MTSKHLQCEGGCGRVQNQLICDIDTSWSGEHFADIIDGSPLSVGRGAQQQVQQSPLVLGHRHAAHADNRLFVSVIHPTLWLTC